MTEIMPWPSHRPQVNPSKHGWLHPTVRARLLTHLGPATDTVVEVGSWLGLSTRFICDRAPEATVCTIDTWEGSEEHKNKPEWAAMLPTLYETFLSSCWDYRERIIPIRGDSVSGMELVSDLSPDLVYLDGDHSYEGVKRDIETVYRLWPDVVIVGDDYHRRDYPGVCQAVDEAADSFLKGHKLLTSGRCWEAVPCEV